MNDPEFFFFTLFKKADVTILLPPHGKSNNWKSVIFSYKRAFVQMKHNLHCF